MSRFKTPEFKRLQRDWYDRLKTEGFTDIEDTNSPEEFLKEWSSSFSLTHAPESFEAQQEYYYLATKFLSSYNFPTVLERTIWELHTDGKSIREISAELHKRNIRFFKDKIHHIIKHLEALMRGLDSPYEKKIEGQLTFDAFLPKVNHE